MHRSTSRLEPVSFGPFVLLVPGAHLPARDERLDERIVRPARRGVRRA